MNFKRCQILEVRVREKLRSEGYVKVSNVLFLKPDFKNPCVLVLHMWYIHVINNLRVLNNDIL